MKEITLKLLYGIMIIVLTNIITPAGKCEKQIKFLCGLMFAGMILCCVFDVLNISLSENGIYSLPAIDGEYEDSGSYKELTGYILSDYSSRLQEDIKDRINKKLPFLKIAFQGREYKILRVTTLIHICLTAHALSTAEYSLSL